MVHIITGISDYYREMADMKTAPPIGVYIKISRLTFIMGTTHAIPLLVKQIALSALSMIGIFFTCGLNKNLRDSFVKNIREGVIFAGAIPIGILGILIPKTIQEKVLQVPLFVNNSDYLTANSADNRLM
jgi:hypothetical protein